MVRSGRERRKKEEKGGERKRKRMEERKEEGKEKENQKNRKKRERKRKRKRKKKERERRDCDQSRDFQGQLNEIRKKQENRKQFFRGHVFFSIPRCGGILHTPKIDPFVGK